jgi:Bacterial Ig-like domain (group 3)/NHL repeat
LKESPVGGGYVQTIVASAGLLSSAGVAVDAIGNVYIADTNNNRVLKETVSGSGYTETVIPTGSLSSPAAVAVDLNGSLYIADTMNNRVLLESLTTGSFIESTIGNNLSAPTGVAIDANGNVYVADTGNQRVLKETLSGGTYSQSVVQTGSPTIPRGVAVGGNGNLYLADSSAGRILLEDFIDPPSLKFSATDIGQTSLDSPQTFSLFNFGNAALTFPVSGADNNPALSTGNFAIDSSTTCPALTPGGIPAILAINASCTYAIKFTPASAGSLADALSISDANLNIRFATQTVSLSGTGIQPVATTLTLTANPPSPVDFQQSETLSATLSPFSSSGHTTAGEVVSFSQNAVPVGTATLDASGLATLTGVPVTAGTNTFQATFAGDAYFTASTSSTATVTSQQLTPAVAWATPAAISFGTALSSTQLNATSSVAGAFVYSPAAGTAPAPGLDTLAVTFTPTDTIDYAIVTATVTLSVSDFSVAAGSGGVTTQSVTAGSPAAFSFTVSSVGLPTILSPTSFSIAGMPSGTSFTFTPANFPGGSSGGAVTLVVQTTTALAGAVPRPLRRRIIFPGSGAFIIVVLACLFISDAFSRRRNFYVVTARVSMSIFALLAVVVALELSGCGITSQGPAAPQISSMTYPFVVSATSGSATHTLSMSLTVHN